jgi:hypothetical protein
MCGEIFSIKLGGFGRIWAGFWGRFLPPSNTLDLPEMDRLCVELNEAFYA